MGDPVIEFDGKSERAFLKWIESTYRDVEPSYKALAGRIGRDYVRRIKASNLSGSGGASLGIGPGRYGHVRSALYAKHGAIGHGMYIRIKYRKAVRFKAWYHEFGTGGGLNKMGEKWGKNLPARAPLRNGFNKVSKYKFYKMVQENFYKQIGAK